MTKIEKVAILGTGIMGTAIASRLIDQGITVTAYNRTVERAQPLAQLGVTVTQTAAQAVADADVVLMILFDADAVVDVFSQAAQAAPANALWVQMSTIGVEGTDAVIKAASQHNVELVEAMMLGTKGPAEAGTLVLLTAGPQDRLDDIDPLLAKISQKRVFSGPAVGAGTRLKLVCNTWIALLTTGTGQAFAMCKDLGLDEKLFLEAIAGGQSDTVYAHVKGALMLADDFQPANFQLRGLRKDLDLAEAATGDDRRFAILDAVRDLYAKADAQGEGLEDIAAVYRALP